MKEEEQALEATEEQDREDEQGAEEAPDEPVVAEGAEETVDEVSALLEELEEAKRREAEYLDGWQRARAELSNARKRFQREQEQAYSGARSDVLGRMLPVVDDFERAFATLPEGMEEEKEAWLGGLRLIWRKLQALLQQEGVSAIEAVGQEFDPHLHQAITHEPSETVPEGHVIDEMLKGYQMDGRVLRPSIVRVSSGPPEPPAAPETGDEEQGVEESEVPETGEQPQQAEERDAPGADDHEEIAEESGEAKAQGNGGPQADEGAGHEAD